MSKIKGYRFDNNGELKSDLRQKLFIRFYEMYKNTKRKIKVFTLPSDVLVFEQTIKEQFGNRVEFVGCETKESIFKKAKRMIKNIGLKMKLFNMKDSDYWAESKEKFDFVWLDYCGPWGPVKKEVLISLAQGNNLNFSGTKPPVVAVTLMEGMDLLGLNELKEAAYDKNNKFKKDEINYRARLGGVPKLLNDAANKTNHTIKPVHIYKYHDKIKKKKATPMLLFVFEVYKGKKKYDVWQTPTTKLVSDTANSV